MKMADFVDGVLLNMAKNDWKRACKSGTVEAAQRIAGHADSRTTKLYEVLR